MAWSATSKSASSTKSMSALSTARDCRRAPIRILVRHVTYAYRPSSAGQDLPTN